MGETIPWARVSGIVISAIPSFGVGVSIWSEANTRAKTAKAPGATFSD